MIEFTQDNPCRCGFMGDGFHRCHAGRNPDYLGEQCQREARPRFVAKLSALAGMQMKVGAQIACYCDECYADAYPIKDIK